MPKLRKAYFYARNKRQRTVVRDDLGIQFAIFGYLVYLVPVETKTQLVKRCYILEIAL